MPERFTQGIDSGALGPVALQSEIVDDLRHVERYSQLAVLGAEVRQQVLKIVCRHRSGWRTGGLAITHARADAEVPGAGVQLACHGNIGEFVGAAIIVDERVLDHFQASLDRMSPPTRAGTPYTRP